MKYPLKRSMLNQNPQNLEEEKQFFHDSRKNNFKFTTEQKSRPNTFSHRLSGGIIRGIN